MAAAPDRLAQHPLAAIAQYSSAELSSSNKSDAAFLAAPFWCAHDERYDERVREATRAAKDRVNLPRRLDRAHATTSRRKAFSHRSRARRSEPCAPCDDERRAQLDHRGLPYGRGSRASSHASGHSAGKSFSRFLLEAPLWFWGKARRLYAGSFRSVNVDEPLAATQHCPPARTRAAASATSAASFRILVLAQSVERERAWQEK